MFGLNSYYHTIRESFEELLEVTFCGGTKYLLLAFVQSRERSLQENQEYEREILSPSREGCTTSGHPRGQPQPPFAADTGELFQHFRDRQKPRKARKYVFFNAKTGEKVLEYGGFQRPLRVTVDDRQEIEVYELGLLVKEIREENFEPYLVFFFCGDFMDRAIKDNQIVLNWAMSYVQIPIAEIFEASGQV